MHVGVFISSTQAVCVLLGWEEGLPACWPPALPISPCGHQRAAHARTAQDSGLLYLLYHPPTPLLYPL